MSTQIKVEEWLAKQLEAAGLKRVPPAEWKHSVAYTPSTKVLGAEGVIRDFERPATELFEGMANELRSRIACRPHDLFSRGPNPHDDRVTCDAIEIDGYPVRVLMSYQPLKAGFLVTFDSFLNEAA